MAGFIIAPFFLFFYLLFGTKTGRKTFLFLVLAVFAIIAFVILSGLFYSVFFPDHMDYLTYNDWLANEEPFGSVIDRAKTWFPWQRPDEWTSTKK